MAALIVTVTAASPALAGAGPGSGSARPVWSLAASPNTLISPDGLSAVSCPAAGYCAAIGGLTANSWAAGRSWTVQQQLPSPVAARYTTMLAMTCTSARFCLAVGDYRLRPDAANTTLLVDRWNGKSWSTVLRSGPGALDALSCSAYNACTAVGSDSGFFDDNSNAIAERWTGTRWIAQSVPPFPGASEIALTGVACPVARTCLATGYDYNLGEGAIPIAARWNGRVWEHSLIADPEPGNTNEVEMEAMSCSSATACSAAGIFYTDTTDLYVPVAERWNGSRWAVQALPAAISFGDGLPPGTVSCPSASFCLIADGTQTSVWNGTRWSLTAAAPVPGGGFAGVSCRSATWCTAVGSVTPAAGGSPTLAERWNGTGWTAQPAAGDPAGALPNSLTSVACPFARNCEAVGTAGSGLLAQHWNGTRWFLQHPAEPAGAATSAFAGVACAGAADCVAVGSQAPASGPATALAEAWHGAAWTLLPSPSGATRLTGISCPAARMCLAVGAGPAGPVIDAWDGTGWTQLTPAAGPARLAGVSCADAGDCVAVGATASGQPAAESWHGTGWTSQPVPAGGALAAVSCPAANSCTAVGAAGTARRWNGTSWSAQRTPSGAVSLTGVACTSSRACVAAGDYRHGTALSPSLTESWNGTTWSVRVPPRPGGSAATTLRAVSCSSARRCTAAGHYRNRAGTTLTLVDIYS